MRAFVVDTLFEVLVFSIATIGVSFYTRFLGDFEEKSHVVDSAVVTTGRLIALLAMLSGFYLAFWGHLSPGGGFAAGVLVALTSSFENMERSFERVHAVVLEKAMTAVFTVCVLLEVAGCSVPTGKVGSLLSGGLIPIYNGKLDHSLFLHQAQRTSVATGLAKQECQNHSSDVSPYISEFKKSTMATTSGVIG